MNDNASRRWCEAPGCIGEPRADDSILCGPCNAQRLAEASADRILRGEGLTYSNSERFSEENWIRMVRDALRRR